MLNPVYSDMYFWVYPNFFLLFFTASPKDLELVIFIDTFFSERLNSCHTNKNLAVRLIFLHKIIQ